MRYVPYRTVPRYLRYRCNENHGGLLLASGTVGIYVYIRASERPPCLFCFGFVFLFFFVFLACTRY